MKVKSFYQTVLLTAEPDDTLADAACTMDFSEIGALAVVDEGSLVGMFTERDLVRAVASGADPTDDTVGEYMTPEPVKVSVEATIEEAAQKMLTLGVRHLPVMDGGKVGGMISIRDVLGPLVWPEAPGVQAEPAARTPR
jgi:CBS domain-containing protein